MLEGSEVSYLKPRNFAACSCKGLLQDCVCEVEAVRTETDLSLGRWRRREMGLAIERLGL